jgi:two-component system chemotaxis response regulator CheB
VATRDIVVVGASAGGVEPLKRLVEALPADLPASVFVVLHIAANHPSASPPCCRGADRCPS